LRYAGNISNLFIHEETFYYIFFNIHWVIIISTTFIDIVLALSRYSHGLLLPAQQYCNYRRQVRIPPPQPCES
jgi:hypothetical protein